MGREEGSWCQTWVALPKWEDAKADQTANQHCDNATIAPVARSTRTQSKRNQEKSDTNEKKQQAEDVHLEPETLQSVQPVLANKR